MAAKFTGIPSINNFLTKMSKLDLQSIIGILVSCQKKMKLWEIKKEILNKILLKHFRSSKTQ